MPKELTKEIFDSLITQCLTTERPDLFILNIFCRDAETQQLFWDRIKELAAPYEIESFIDLGRGFVVPRNKPIGGKIIIWPHFDSYPRNMRSTHCIFDEKCSYEDVKWNFLCNNLGGDENVFSFQRTRLEEILNG